MRAAPHQTDLGTKVDFKATFHVCEHTLKQAASLDPGTKGLVETRAVLVEMILETSSNGTPDNNFATYEFSCPLTDVPTLSEDVFVLFFFKPAVWIRHVGATVNNSI